MTNSTDVPVARAELEARLLELTSLLDAEYDAIRERDAEVLDRLSLDKQTLVASIDTAAAAADVTALFADPSNAAGQRLQALMSRCRQANTTNGAAIETSQTFTTSLLDILRGRIPGERTYNARGRLGVRSETGTLVRV